MNNESISKIFDVLKSWVFALSLRNNVSTLFCVCTLQNLTTLQNLLNLLNKCGFFNTGFGYIIDSKIHKYRKWKIVFFLLANKQYEECFLRFTASSEHSGLGSLHTNYILWKPGVWHAYVSMKHTRKWRVLDSESPFFSSSYPKTCYKTLCISNIAGIKPGKLKKDVRAL